MNKKLEKARFFYQKGKYTKAKDLCISACKLEANNAQCHLLLGKIYLKSCDYEQAAKQFNNVIKINPQSSEAHCGLGQTYLKLKKIQKAEEHFNSSQHLKANNIEAKIGLADVFLSKGSHAEAKQLLDLILKHQPGNISALYRMGQIKLNGNSFDQAAIFFKQVLILKPKHKQANYDLACILQSKGDMEQSIELLKKVVLIDPQYFSAHMKLGHLLFVVDKCRAAIDVYKKALKLAPDSMDAIAGIVSVLDRSGNPQEAYKKLQPFIEKNVLHPGFAMAYAKMCPKLGRYEEAISYMDKVLNTGNVSDKNKIEMHYSLADLYDKNKHFDYAYINYKKANDLRSDNYSDIEHRALIDSIIKTFTQNQFSSMPRSTIDTNKPVFIVGMPRSGTSLTEQILACHDQVFGAGELRAIGDEISRLNNKYGANVSYPQYMTNITADDIYSAAKNYIKNIEAVSSSKIYVTDKMPHNFMYLGVISLMFPNAHIIHCKRDPRDICLSIYFQNFHDSHRYATRMENIISHYKDYSRLMDHWKLVLNTPVLDVQYEELVKDQQGVTRKILEFLGLEWDEKCLSFHKAKRSVATSSHSQVTQKIYTDSIARWKNYETHFGDLFNKMGI